VGHVLNSGRWLKKLLYKAFSTNASVKISGTAIPDSTEQCSIYDGTRLHINWNSITHQL